MANWTQTEIGEIWEKAEYIDEKNEPNGFRKDQCGAWIKWSDYGNRNSKYGWEIDHIKPASKGGEDIVSNARPLHWKNNASRQDGRLTKVVTSKGTKNILVETGEEFNPND
jgi:5-methylcytosine-specific restriction endonuclease McrA